MVKSVCILVVCALAYCVVADDPRKIDVDAVAQAFKEMDTDGDSKVTVEEVAAHLESVKSDPEADSMDMAKPVFEFYDKNKDGFVVFNELLPRDEL